MKAKISLQVFFVMVLALALSGVTGCSRSSERSDAQVAGDVQSKISSDATLAGRQISINANKGVITLSGSVNSDAELMRFAFLRSVVATAAKYSSKAAETLAWLTAKSETITSIATKTVRSLM